MNGSVGFDDIRALLVSHIDNAGISRVKVLPHRRLLSASTHGATVSHSVGLLFSVDDHLNATEALDPVVGDAPAGDTGSRLVVCAHVRSVGR